MMMGRALLRAEYCKINSHLEKQSRVVLYLVIAQNHIDVYTSMVIAEDPLDRTTNKNMVLISE
jgi:hypothetical protein